MENTQKKLLYVLEDGVVESEVKLLPRLKQTLQGLMAGRGAGLRKLPLFEIKVNGCWIWLGHKNEKGYGIIFADGKPRRTHRYFYQRLIERISDGLELDHLCRVRDCSNPEHLEPVTNKVNVLRGIGKTAVNAIKTHCDNGHEFTTENTYIVLGKGWRNCKKCTYESNLANRKKS